MNHFLSFILPCYNYAEIIEQSLESIYKQNLKIPFEVIATDDLSTDNKTREILRKWEKKYDNFHAHFHRENQGEGGALNTCIKHSKGDLFFCLDTDNVLVSNSVEGLIDLLDELKCEGACFNELWYFKIGTDEKSYKKSHFLRFGAKDSRQVIVDIHHITSTNRTPADSGNYLFTKESWERAGGYPENNCMGSWGFGFRQHATGSRIAVLRDSFYWHRISVGGLYMTNLRKGNIGRDVWSVVSQHIDIFTEETQELLKKDEYKYAFKKWCGADKIRLKER